jgi:hypothetical protein
MAVKKSLIKRKTNLLKLYSEMNKMVKDAVDKEVAKRFRIIIDLVETDISKTTLADIMKRHNTIELDRFGEGVKPYIKHYVFMVKRGL